MSKLVNTFVRQTIRERYRSWPLTANGNRDEDLKVALIFKQDAGYIKVSTQAGNADISFVPHASKASLDRETFDLKIYLESTVRQFERDGVNLQEARVEGINEITDEKYNQIAHMLKVASACYGNSGRYNARNSISL
jgi:hypothetical protein